MFTVYVGQVGSGKTYAMAKAAMEAYERGEPVFSNIDLDPEAAGWDSSKGGKIVRWRQPLELLSPQVRCGTVLFDELGAIVNNREYEFWPIDLTVKIIEHRKDHLDFHASVQDDELADKNIRRFYNRVYFMSEHRWPLLALLKKSAARPDLPCPNPACHKQDKCLTHGDGVGFPWKATWYAAKDVHPKYTQNKEKHMSRGVTRTWFNPKVAAAYASGGKISEDAQRYHRAMEEAARKQGKYHKR